MEHFLFIKMFMMISIITEVKYVMPDCTASVNLKFEFRNMNAQHLT